MTIEDSLESQSEFGKKLKKWVANNPLSLLIFGLFSLLVSIGVIIESLDKIIVFWEKHTSKKVIQQTVSATQQPASIDSSKNSITQLPENQQKAASSNPPDAVLEASSATNPKKSSSNSDAEKSRLQELKKVESNNSTPADLILNQTEKDLKSTNGLSRNVDNGVTVDMALALIAGQTLSDRREAVRGLYHRLPLPLSGNDIARILAEETLGSRLELMTLLVSRAEKDSFSANEVRSIISNEVLSNRAEMIVYLVPFIKPGLTADELVDILGPLTLSHRVQGIKAIAAKIRKPLAASDVEKILGGLALSNRNSAIAYLL
jgi:hypothetical protein